MITKQDALSYFNQILKMEKTMADIYHDMIQKIKEPHILKELQILENDEYVHADAVQNLKDLLDKYWKD